MLRRPLLLHLLRPAASLPCCHLRCHSAPVTCWSWLPRHCLERLRTPFKSTFIVEYDACFCAWSLWEGHLLILQIGCRCLFSKSYIASQIEAAKSKLSAWYSGC